MQFTFLLEQVVNGLVLGGYYLLIALGLSLIFSVGGVVNLAHGAFYALGAYLSVEITNYLGFGAAVAISPLAVALLGILFERFILRRFYTCGSDPEPARDLCARHGRRTGDPHHLGLAAAAGLDRAGVSRLGHRRRLPVLALPPAHSRGGRRRADRRLAAAAQDLVRTRGPRRHPAARHGRGARHPAAALHDRDRDARRRHGGARRRVLCADLDRASGDGRRDHHDRLCRGRDRRPRQLSGAW